MVDDNSELEGIAIIGMSGRFPGAPDLEQFWQNLVAGIESIKSYSLEEIRTAGVPENYLSQAQFVPVGALLQDIELFDADFFGYTALEAQLMDPQHRLFLQSCQLALDDAAIDPKRYSGSIGVYAGTSMNTYLLNNIRANEEMSRRAGLFQMTVGNDKDFLTTRVSYKLGLRGPSVNVQTACSSALVAVNLAVSGLLNYQGDLFLAGGVSVMVPHRGGYLYQEGGVMSPDGHCRAFDAQARGTVRGNGVGVVVLKRLEDAVADRDPIYAVIKGTAMNNDGADKVGFTAPAVDGQAAVIAEALELSGVEADTITYIETHGTGTEIGDPIEIAALTQVFNELTDRRNYCAIGSLKTNIGHLDAAAGVASLIKVALALKNATIPPSLHFSQANPQIDFGQTPFFVNTKARPWPDEDGPKRAGISSFGIGGTNVHVIVEEAPPKPEPTAGPPSPLIFPLSARSAEALDAMGEQLGSYLISHPQLSMTQVAYTLQQGRQQFEHRRVLVATTQIEIVDGLRKNIGQVGYVRNPREEVVFGFPGQGAQYIGMGRDLYQTEPRFREVVDQCAQLLTTPLKEDLRSLIFGTPSEEASARLRQTQITQPALFVISYGLYCLWQNLGVNPSTMIGHSIGEYVAATIAGVFSLKDALNIVCQRGRLMAEQPSGVMLAVSAGEEQVRALIAAGTHPTRVEMAALNTAKRTVVAGSEDAIIQFEQQLAAAGLVGRRLHTSHAYHTSMMEPACAPFAALLKKIRLAAPKIPFISCLTGDWITDEQAQSPEYWAKQLRSPVQFATGLEKLKPDSLFIELGPGANLSTFTREYAFPTVCSLPKFNDAKPDQSFFHEALAQLWLKGLELDWARLYREDLPARISLPGYVFQGKPYWVEPGKIADPAVSMSTQQTPPCPTSVEPLKAAALPPQSIPSQQHAPRQSRYDKILAEVKQMLAQLIGLPQEEVSEDVTFMDLDLDSLILMQVSQNLQDHFGMPVSFRNLMGDLNSPSSLANFLDHGMPTAAFPPEPEPQQVAAAPATASASHSTQPATFAGVTGNPSLTELMAQQLAAMNQLMANQLEALKGIGAAPSASASLPSNSLAVPDPGTDKKPKRSSKVSAGTFVAFQPLQVRSADKFSAEQEAYLQAFITRFNQRTRLSKERVQRYRKAFADNRNAAGFRLPIKELVYPIIAERSKGAQMWDVDGNQYLDLTMGFGVNYFGHSPDFIDKAIREQLDKGIQLGPQSDTAGEVAELICQLTHTERVAFCNSGTEAVMVALRLARTVTGRNGFAMFAGSYHGTFDGILARPDQSGGDPVPLAPGISPHYIADATVLEYGSEEALEIIREHARDWSAILIETVQSRRPDYHPKAFIQEVRKITEKTGTALIFDEIITGFRLHPAGAQAFYDTRADLVTYGKVIGGGMPLGVVAGISKFMDPIDGGDWQFGNDSYPTAEQTFFAGTFCKHPLTLAAAKAVLLRLKAEGPVLQERLNQRTEQLVDTLNRDFNQWGLPIVLVRCASLFRFTFPREMSRTMDLFFYKLLEKGIYIWEGRNCFLSLAHQTEELEHFRKTIAVVVKEMQDAKFFEDAGRAPLPVDSRSEDPIRLPLTAQQEEVWLGTKTSVEANVAFNETVLLRLGGSLDENALEGALEQLVQRHQALRSRFESEGEFQVIMPVVNVNLMRLNLAREEEPEPALAKHVLEKQKQPLDLEKGPAWRFVLYRLGSGRYALQIVLHHIVADGWSTGVLVSELLALYQARKEKMAPLPEAPAIADYIQRIAASAHADEAFWRQHFLKLPPTAELPCDFRRPPYKTYKGAKASLTLSGALLQKLKEVSRRHKCTLFVTTLAAYQLLHHKLSGCSDGVIGIPAAGQTLNGFSRLVGHCVNLLPIRSRLKPGATFQEFLADMKATWTDAMDHQYYAFGALVKVLDLARDPGRTPLLDCTFNMERITGSGLKLPGMDLEVVTNPSPGAKFDLSFDVFEKGSGLSVECVYNTDLFTHTTITRWLAHYQHLLQSIADEHQEPVHQWSLCNPQERDFFLKQWSNSERAFPQKSLHLLFEEQAAMAGGHLALLTEKGDMSYRDLDQSANQWAHVLIKKGVKPEQPVAICLERSVALPLAIFAVLKAGGTYVPIDPAYPVDQRSLRLQLSGARLLITQAPWAWTGDHEIIDLDPQVDLALPKSPPKIQSDAQQLAYIIFTSGSTGVPKGVAIAHQGVVNLVNWHNHRYHITPKDQVAIFAGPAFDASVWEHMPHLLAGATLVVPNNDVRGTPALLPEWLADKGITLCFMPTPLAEAFLKEPLPANLALRALLTGGDKLQNAQEGTLPFSLHNHYGPTEDSVVSTCCKVVAGYSGAPPIGRGLPNKRLYVLDAQLNLSPLGVPGQLLLGGVGLARGYWNMPAKTAEVFIPNPYGAPGSRLYTTGDLVAHHEDGDLRFIGRKDNQVQIRGFRVELGEIEATLNRLNSVQESLVMLTSKEGPLTAYIIAQTPDAPPDAQALKRDLRASLPDYMVPSVFAFLTAWPLTPNGKVDRRRLPKPQTSRVEQAESALEQMIALIFVEVLQVKDVPRSESFFDMGGHSLLAARVLTQIKQQCGVALPLRELFASPTVAELALAVRAHLSQEAGIQIPDLVRYEGKTLPLSYAQQRLWFLDKLGSHNAYNIPVVLRFMGALNCEAMVRAVARVGLRQESLRTVFVAGEDGPIQCILAEAPNLTQVDFSQEPEAQRDAQIKQHINQFCGQIFDLGKGPLFAAQLLKLASDEHILVMCMHHIIADGWSVNVLFNELDHYYKMETGLTADELAPLRIQYKDYAAWQRDWLQGETLKTMLSYWANRIGKGPEPLQLPTDYARPMVQTTNGDMFIFSLSEELSRKVEALAREQSVTMFMTTLAAFQLLLHRFSGASTILVGSPVAGRDHDMVKDLVGFFINTLVFRADFNGQDHFVDLLRQVRQGALEALAHQDVPFEQLVEALEPERSLNVSPVFQVMFTLQNVVRNRAQLGGLETRFVDPELKIAKFDLTLIIEEYPECLAGSWEYNTDLFTRTRIERMHQSFVTLLEHLVADPKRAINQQEIVPPAERKTLLEQFNTLLAQGEAPRCLHQHVQAHAHQHPQTLALLDATQQLSYAALEDRANQLAQVLRSRGVGPQTLAGICLPRTLERIVAMVAVMKTGAAYVPLDPDYPEDRLAFMIEDASLSVVICNGQNKLPLSTATLFHLDHNRDTLFNAPTGALNQQVSLDAVAYVIYTSGSTGKPKGVLVPHRGLGNLVLDQRVHFDVQPGDRVLQFASFSFDASVLETVIALGPGGTLCVAPPQRLLPGPELHQVLAEMQITHVFLSPSSLAALPDLPLPKLKFLAVGAEACSEELVRRWGVARKMYNLYGPTEATIYASQEHCLPNQGNPSIGKPIQNAGCYILDRYSCLLPIGFPGELCIGGEGVTRGYLNRPGITAEKFIPNAFGPAGSRLYRTGDLARFMPDGKLDFMGRIDHQIKIRGQRVELGEVETALLHHPQVKDALVAVSDPDSSSAFLAAYIICMEGCAAIEDLRGFVSVNLPHYMVPSVFIYLDKFPQTPNGKLDRKALPDPKLHLEGSKTQAVGPIAEMVASTFCELLHISAAGMNDSFFELGGHSLLAARLATRLSDIFGFELPVSAVFSSPTVAELARFLEQGGTQRQALPQILPGAGRMREQLSFAQQRLWFIHLMEPSSAYNIPMAFALEGSLDRAKLGNCLKQLIRRHESLRTHFEDSIAGPFQVIRDGAHWQMSWVDLEGSADSDAAVQRLIQGEVNHVFDLTQGPLFRATLVRKSTQAHVLMLNCHHIISDGWSTNLLFGELKWLYETEMDEDNQGPSLVTYQYRDYARWQREVFTAEHLSSQLQWWKDQLGLDPEPLALPSDYPRPPVQTFNGARQVFALGSELSAPFLALGQQHGATPFMSLLAVFQVLLYRYTGSKTILLGSPISGRHHKGTEEILGFFVNTLVLRGALSLEIPFSRYLRQVLSMTLSAFTHQDVPFEELVEALKVTRDPGTAPIFQVMFTFQNVMTQSLSLGQLKALPLNMGSHHAKYDLTLTLAQTEEGLVGGIEYNTDLYKPTRIKAMSQHFINLLGAIVQNPDTELGRLSLMDECERARILHQFAGGARPYPDGATLQHQFAAQAALRPDEIAVCGDDQNLTYGQLNQRANQLAHLLKSKGVGMDDLVGICLGRSFDLTIALLGVLKAGAAYVPLDPSYPPERLAFMCSDCALDLILTHDPLVEALPQQPERLSMTAHCYRQMPTHDLDDKTDSLARAYINYTSGSTGNPKGVQTVHRNVLRLVYDHDYMRCQPGDGVAHVANTSFDATTFEVWTPLLLGGRICLLERDLLFNPKHTATWLKQQRVRHMFMTTALVNQFAKLLPHTFNELETLLFGGERVDVHSIRRIREAGGPKRMLHVYGPTETTTFATWYEVAELSEKDSNLAIGKAIGNTSLYLLDPRGQMVPIGIPGELFIGGAGLSRGYLGRPALTSWQFIPDPFSEVAGQRLYRTGDLCCFMEDGNLLYLSRIDRQVKLRGFRIELGEIENRLRQHPAISQVHVTLYRFAQGDQRLVAYIGCGDREVRVAQLRSFLGEQMPEFMVPAHFSILETLPLTPNGKLDTRALPKPEEVLEAKVENAAPRDPLEEVLQTIWEELLGVNVGVFDNFFDAGGHSLLAARVVSRMSEELKREIPVRVLFDHPSIASTAAWLQAQGNQAAGLSKIESRPAGGNAPLSFAQQRMWFLHALDPSPVYNMPFILRMIGALNRSALRMALVDIVATHEVLRSVYPRTQVSAEMQTLAPETFDVQLIDLSKLGLTDQDKRVAELCDQAATRIFCLDSGPVFDSQLILLDPNHHVLLLNMHHIAADGWSMNLLFTELEKRYGAYAQGQQPALEPPTIQYGDFSHWQRNWLKGEVLEQMLAFWKEKLGHNPEPLDLPLDFPRPVTQTFKGKTHSFAIDLQTCQALQSLGRTHGATLYMIFMAAYQTLMHRYTSAQRILVGSPIAGRSRPETQNLIGLFANTLVIRGNCEGDPSFSTYLKRVRGEVLDAFSHQDLPFEQLVEGVVDERNLSTSPIFQVFFSLQNMVSGKLHLAGLECQPMAPAAGVAKFDLSMMMQALDEGYLGVWEYNTDLFSAATMEKMGQHMQRLLHACAHQPETLLSQLPLLNDEEHLTLMVTWNQTQGEGPAMDNIADMVERCVQRQGQATALHVGQSQYSFEQINSRANRLARLLLVRGVSMETPIALCFPRCAELIISMLACLKAGASYVPLDPNYPEERNKIAVDDAQAPLILTLSQQLPTLHGLPQEKLCTDRHADELAALSPENLTRSIDGQHLAYTLFTSGSTGRPKGVAIPHRAVCAMLHWGAMTYSAAERARVLASTSVCFDLSVYEIFLPLTSDGTVDLVDNALVLIQDPRPVSTINTVPSAMTELLAQNAVPQSTCTVNLAGEALPRELVDGLYALPHIKAVYNLYGPSEDTTYSTFERVPREEVGAPMIGRPLQGTGAFILDRKGQLLPAHIPGELCLGGLGLARGYLNQPALTAGRFIPNSFAQDDQSGSRLYRTGDLVRYEKTGNPPRLAYLGRIDRQVKLRGFRIELGEIESRLNRHPTVERGVALVRDEGGRQRLVAYVAPHALEKPSEQQLQSYLEQHLPEYMVPSVIVVLARIPLTPNGKVDIRALPAPELETTGNRTKQLPTNHVELILLGIWEELLDIHPISVLANFFKLGGHSILAVRLMSDIRAQLNVDLPISILFKKPTIKELAAHIREGEPTVKRSLVPIQPLGNKRPLFCVHPVGGNSLCYFELAMELGFDQPVYGIESVGVHGDKEPLERVEDMARHYISEMRSVQPHGPYQILGWSFGGLVCFEMGRQLMEINEQISLLVILDSHAKVVGKHAPDIRKEQARFLYVFGHEQARMAKVELKISLNHLLAIEPEEQEVYYLKCAQAAGMYNTETAAISLKRVLRVSRGNTLSMKYFEPKGYPVRVSLFKPREVVPEELEIAKQMYGLELNHPANAWDELPLVEVDLFKVPGDHATMGISPNVEVLASILEQQMAVEPNLNRHRPEIRPDDWLDAE